MFDQRKTSDNIRPFVNAELIPYNLSLNNDNVVFISDEGTNLVAMWRNGYIAIKSFLTIIEPRLKSTRIGCACHMLNTAMRVSFELASKESATLGEQIEKCKQLVGYFSRSEAKVKLTHTLKQEVVTRWLTIYGLHLLLSEKIVLFCSDNRNDIENVLLKHNDGKDLYRFAGINLRLVKLLVDFLLPFNKSKLMLYLFNWQCFQHVRRFNRPQCRRCILHYQVGCYCNKYVNQLRMLTNQWQRYVDV
jgi:hypothetical protein